MDETRRVPGAEDAAAESGFHRQRQAAEAAAARPIEGHGPSSAAWRAPSRCSNIWPSSRAAWWT